MMENKIKVHFPDCGCNRNSNNKYFIFSYSDNDRKKINFENYTDMIMYLKNKNYSVCINEKTSESNFNGGVVLITLFPRQIRVENKNNDEIEFANFYNIDTLKYLLNHKKIKEHKDFTPIQFFYNVFGKILSDKYFILLCKEKQYDILSFPKGKRLICENSTECAIRELYEESGLVIKYEEEEQVKIRQELKLNIPRCFNYKKFHFKIILKI